MSNLSTIAEPESMLPTLRDGAARNLGMTLNEKTPAALPNTDPVTAWAEQLAAEAMPVPESERLLIAGIVRTALDQPAEQQAAA